MKIRKYSPFVFVATLLVLCGGCSSAEEKIVRAGSFDACKGATVDGMVKGFFGSPSWATIKADDGNTYVNIKGAMTFMEKPVTGLVQFRVDKNTGRFETNAFEMNGIPQNGLMLYGLLTKLCEAGGGTLEAP